MTAGNRANVSSLALWVARSVSGQVFAAVAAVGAGTVLAKFVAAVKEMAVADRFGTADALDAFLIAFLLPSFAINVAAGSLTPALVPGYIEARERRGPEAAAGLLGAVLRRTAVLLLSVTFLLAVTGPFLLPFLAIGFPVEKLALTRSVFFFLLPMIAVSGLSAVWSGVLNAHERFALAAAAPVFQPIGILGALLVGGEAWGVSALVAGTLIGVLAEAFVVAWGLIRLGASPWPRAEGGEAAAKTVVRDYWPLAVGSILMGSTTLVDQAMAGMLPSGSVSILSYGSRLSGFIAAAGAMALGTAVLPHFSRLLAAGEAEAVDGLLRKSMLWVGLAGGLAAAALIAASPGIVTLWFQRGAFGPEDTAAVTLVQRLLLLQIPFYMLGMLHVRLVSALRANHVLLWGTCISVVVNFLLNLFFMRLIGVAGIALSTSLVHVIQLVYLRLMGARLLRNRRMAVGLPS